MCQNLQHFRLCTCQGKPISADDYRWTLKRYVGQTVSTMDGMLIEPDFELSPELTEAYFTAELNQRPCFDFDYLPSEGDNLYLYNPRSKSYRLLSFIFRSGQWVCGSYNGFADETEDFNGGKISFE